MDDEEKVKEASEETPAEEAKKEEAAAEQQHTQGGNLKQGVASFLLCLTPRLNLSNTHPLYVILTL